MCHGGAVLFCGFGDLKVRTAISLVDDRVYLHYLSIVGHRMWMIGFHSPRYSMPGTASVGTLFGEADQLPDSAR